MYFINKTFSRKKVYIFRAFSKTPKTFAKFLIFFFKKIYLNKFKNKNKKN